MLNAWSVEFPQVEYQEAKCCYEEHNYQETVSCACHDVECEREQNWHIVNFKFIDFLEPALNDSVFFWGLAGLNDRDIESLMRLILWSFPFTFLPLGITLLWSGAVFIDINEVFDQPNNHEDSEDESC